MPKLRRGSRREELAERNAQADCLPAVQGGVAGEVRAAARAAPGPNVLCAQRLAATSGATQLAGDLSGATQLAAAGATQLHPSTTTRKNTAMLVCGSTSYPLREGRNTVGRKASTSVATTQIATADRYMSRQHAVITVSTLPDGTLKAVFTNDQNKNLTTIDGQPIEAGDAIRLASGNRITMGKTAIIFKTDYEL